MHETAGRGFECRRLWPASVSSHKLTRYDVIQTGRHTDLLSYLTPIHNNNVTNYNKHMGLNIRSWESIWKLAAV